MDMIRYTAFCKVVETGSFTKAAEKLGYTQAAVSQMIRSLEEELGFILLNRSHGGVRLTGEGERIYPFVQNTVAALQVLHDKAGEVAALEDGEIRIGSISSISQHWLPWLMQKFTEQYPHVRFHVYQSDISIMRDWLRSGYVDFCFIYQEEIPGFQNIMLAEDSFLAVVPEEHPLTRYTVLPLEMLTHVPLIAAEEGDISTVLSAFESLGLEPHVPYRIHDDNTILAMVEKGLGVSILPAMVLDRTKYRFCAIPTIPAIRRKIGIASRESTLLTHATARFLAFLVENIEECIREQFPTGQYIFLLPQNDGNMEQGGK